MTHGFLDSIHPLQWLAASGLCFAWAEGMLLVRTREGLGVWRCESSQALETRCCLGIGTAPLKTHRLYKPDCFSDSNTPNKNLNSKAFQVVIQQDSQGVGDVHPTQLELHIASYQWWGKYRWRGPRKHPLQRVSQVQNNQRQWFVVVTQTFF